VIIAVLSFAYSYRVKTPDVVPLKGLTVHTSSRTMGRERRKVDARWNSVVAGILLFLMLVVRGRRTSSMRFERGRGIPSVVEGNAQSARSAGLVYVTDRAPGIRRVRRGRGFRYIEQRGRVVSRRSELDRIAKLAVPPAWKDVWICPHPRGHLQACGRDARGRKQYRYHAHWRRIRDEVKFDQMLTFATALPALRRQIARDLATPGLPRRKVIAAVVRLLEKTLIRVGNDEYARDNNSYGLTTMRNRHVRVTRSTLRFRFTGKAGKTHDIAFNDVRLAKIVRRCRDLPGHELFAYVDDDGTVRDVGSGDVNDYLREITGQEFTAKTFRTWAATVLAACALQDAPECRSATEAKRHVVRAVEAVAGLLGNTATICKKSYVHPAILEAYMDGSLPRTRRRRSLKAVLPPLHEFQRMETAVHAWLQRLQRAAQKRSA
jgi:DNA topoisomerase-1